MNPENKSNMATSKESFGEKMKRLRLERARIKEQIVSKANSNPKIDWLAQEGKNDSIPKIDPIESPKKPIQPPSTSADSKGPWADIGPYVDYDPKTMNGFERALTGWGALALLLIPLGILAGIVLLFKDWFQQNIGNIFNGVAYLALFVGIGNMMFDVLSKAGLLRPLYSMIGLKKKK